MRPNDVVFQDYNNIRRYGVVTEMITKENDWAYAKVKWFNDDKYQHAMDYLNEMRGGDHYLHEYRVDRLKVVDLKWEIDALSKCFNFVKKQRSLF